MIQTWMLRNHHYLPVQAKEAAEIADEIECLRGDNIRFKTAIEKINEIRNSIIGLQTMNWSEHIYPLVAALEEAGIKGMRYPEARDHFGTMLDRTLKAEDDRDKLKDEIERLKSQPTVEDMVREHLSPEPETEITKNGTLEDEQCVLPSPTTKEVACE